MIIPTKTTNTILNEMINELKARSDITNFKTGSMARTLLEVINTQFGDIYSTLNINLLQSFVSTASGIYLEYIGQLVGCARLSSESDYDYRYRITRQYLSFAKANETAIRLACLSITGVNDVVIEEFLYGTGSLGIYLITDELIPSIGLIETAQGIVDEVKAFGIYARVLPQQLADINIQYSLVYKKNAVVNSGVLLSNLKTAIQAQLDRTGLGGNLSIADLVRLPYTVSNNILESRILSIDIDGETIYNRENYNLSRVTRARVLNLKVN